MKNITIEALRACIFSPIQPQTQPINDKLVFSCAEIHRIYHQYLKPLVSEGTLTESEAVAGLHDVVRKQSQTADKSEFCSELENRLGIEKL